MKFKDINVKNVRAFLEGNSRMLGARLDLVDDHIKEQVAYRATLCGDCLDAGSCKFCGCSTPGKLYVAESCNKGERFPNLMNKKEWESFKKENNIVL